jgi:hypothetical protein
VTINNAADPMDANILKWDMWKTSRPQSFLNALI